MQGKIRFVKNKDDMAYNPKKCTGTFYQFCQYKNSSTRNYSSRKIIFDENYEILKAFEKEYPIKKINKYIETHKPTKFKIYPTNDISNVGLPNGNDMVECFSDLLNNDNMESGCMEVDFD